MHSCTLGRLHFDKGELGCPALGRGLGAPREGRHISLPRLQLRRFVSARHVSRQYRLIRRSQAAQWKSRRVRRAGMSRPVSQLEQALQEKLSFQAQAK